MIDGSITTYSELKEKVIRDLTARTEWSRKDEEIIRRRLGYRPRYKTKPYPGAPNYVEMVIDDVVREKTDQEISMLFNAPRVCHVAPLDDMTPEQRADIEVAFDSYMRFIVPQGRAKIEELLDCKNARGFSVAKLTRTFSPIMQRLISDFLAKDILDIIVPCDTKHLQDSDYVCDVLRYTPRDVRRVAKEKSWDEAAVERALTVAKRKDDLTGRTTGIEQDTYQKTKTLVGITTSTTEYLVVWEVYRYADETDAARNPELIDGRRMVSVFCPDLPEMPFAEFPWRENGTTIADPALAAAALNEQKAVMVANVVETVGADKPWPFVQFRYEQRSCRWYDSRGAGHLVMDEQIGATAMRNAEAKMIEFFLTPMLKGNVQNSQNVNFTPGSVLPDGVDFVKPPDIPQQFSFSRNDFKATAGRRVGANGVYNYSTRMSETRKVQKSATEIDSEDQRGSLVSSASVDRFNEPMAELCQMLWADMARLTLPLPMISPASAGNPSAPASALQPDIYAKRVMLIPASSAKTLNPDTQLGRFMQMFQFNATYAQQTGFDFMSAMRCVNSAWDSRMTQGWIPSGAQATNFATALAAIQQAIQQLAAGGQDLEKRMAGVEQLANILYEKQNPKAIAPPAAA